MSNIITFNLVNPYHEDRICSFCKGTIKAYTRYYYCLENNMRLCKKCLTNK